MLRARFLSDYAGYLPSSITNQQHTGNIADLDWAALLEGQRLEQKQYKHWQLYGPNANIGPGPPRPLYKTILWAAAHLKLKCEALEDSAVIEEIERYISRKAQAEASSESEVGDEPDSSVVEWGGLATRVLEDLKLVGFVFGRDRRDDVLKAVKAFKRKHFRSLTESGNARPYYEITPECAGDLENRWCVGGIVVTGVLCVRLG